jgi:ABC-2 type transport system permease protein
MIAAPGSPLWLLRHELRLLWRRAGKVRVIFIVAALIFLFFQLLAFAIAAAVSSMPALSTDQVLMTRVAVSGASLVALLLMFSTGLDSCVQAIYTRGDMNLLLSSPVDPRTIVLVRAGAIAVTLAGGIGILVLPFANAFAVLVSPRWLMVYADVICLGLVATALSLVASLGLFRLLGARRTRVFAQIVGGVVGTAAVLLVQLPNAFSNQDRRAVTDQFGTFLTSFHWPAADSWAWLPARALMGEPLLLLAVIVLSVGLFALVACGLSDRFIASMVAAGGTETSGSRRRGARRRFNTATATVLRRKDLRLIARDPWLLTQILRQAIFVAPLAFVAWRSGVSALPTVSFLLILLAGNLGGTFGWLAASGETVPDLVSTAPLRPRDVFRAKFEAAMLPIAFALVLPVAFVGWIAPWFGCTLALCCTGAAASNGLLHIFNPVAGQRGDFNKRAKGRIGLSIVEFAVSAAWAGTGAAMAYSPWLGLLGLALLAAPLTMLLRGWRDGAPIALPA